MRVILGASLRKECTINRNYRVQTVVLANGLHLRVRPIRPDDAARLQAFATRLSAQTIFLRMNMVHPASLTDAEAAAATDIDFRSRMALVAVTGADAHEQIVGVARYSTVLPAGRHAEVGIVVEDAYQGQGIGSQLLQRLAEYAAEQGLHRLVATISARNAGVQALICRSGFPADYAEAGWGEYQVSVRLKGRPWLYGRALPAGGSIVAALRRYFR